MARDNTHTCKTCGKQYTHCMNCSFDKAKNSGYCSNECHSSQFKCVLTRSTIPPIKPRLSQTGNTWQGRGLAY